MRIVALHLEMLASMGLKPSTMRPLSDLVVLAGPNGAGKSRILQAVNEILSDNHLSDVAGYRGALKQHENLAREGRSPHPEHQVAGFREIVRHAESVTLDGPFVRNTVVDFFPNVYRLRDHRALNEAGQKQAAEQVAHLGVKQLEQNALAYLARIERRWFSATHQNLEVEGSIKQSATNERTRLAELIREFLGVSPELDLDQQPTLFGRPIAEARLSHGQSVLLQVAVALHAQASKLDGLVLLLDEPECHLHPAAIIEAINKLRSLNPLGQIWVATHCVPVLAALPTESIWYVNDGGVSWAGRRPEIVLEGLLGGPSGRERMEEFLRLPAQFAGSRFAAECLVPPKAVGSATDDPQARQLREFCQVEASAADAPLRVLDFGAGQGRLLSAMRGRWEGPAEFTSAVDYRAFEPYPDGSGQLERNIAAVYSSGERRRLFARDDELATIDAGSIDLVVMCNVLHEIPPERWRLMFGSEGVVTRVLAPKGHLLILEDMEIPHGEKAHRFGFLLLDSVHLHKLMRCTEADPRPIKTVTARSGRLKAHAIPAALLGRTDREATVAALTLLRDSARAEITTLRAAPPDSRNGRLHALWTQLLANADLGLLAL